MTKPEIICIDDQREILAALGKDLESLTTHFEVNFCESAAEANELIDDLEQEGQAIALLICDHVMPGKNGVDFLVELYKSGRFPALKKILLTGQATHKDTIIAINEAEIDRYVEKPWTKEGLLTTVKILLTEFLFESGEGYEDFIEVMDQQTLYRLLR